MIDQDPFDPKEQVRQATDIVDLLGGYLDLRRQGRVYRALCPFHDDSRPSLHVDPERQFWKCWVCNVGGDVFSFVMHKEGVAFREALELLAERAGIQLRHAPQTKVEKGSPQDKRTLHAALEWAAKQYHQCFLTSPEAAGVLTEYHTAHLGRELFSVHLLSVEIAGTLLLVALIGAIAIVIQGRDPVLRRGDHEPAGQTAQREVQPDRVGARRLQPVGDNGRE